MSILYNKGWLHRIKWIEFMLNLKLLLHAEELKKIFFLEVWLDFTYTQVHLSLLHVFPVLFEFHWTLICITSPPRPHNMMIQSEKNSAASSWLIRICVKRIKGFGNLLRSFQRNKEEFQVLQDIHHWSDTSKQCAQCIFYLKLMWCIIHMK